eukprot:scaffold14005_cov30-Tisochrysis_lutea.AAC.2
MGWGVGPHNHGAQMGETRSRYARQLPRAKMVYAQLAHVSAKHPRAPGHPRAALHTSSASFT